MGTPVASWSAGYPMRLSCRNSRGNLRWKEHRGSDQEEKTKLILHWGPSSWNSWITEIKKRNHLKCWEIFKVPAHMSVELEVKITSWNCKGLQKTKKVKQAINRIKILQSKTVFFQETHLTHDDELKMRRRWKGKTVSPLYLSGKACHDCDSWIHPTTD